MIQLWSVSLQSLNSDLLTTTAVNAIANLYYTTRPMQTCLVSKRHLHTKSEVGEIAKTCKRSSSLLRCIIQCYIAQNSYVVGNSFEFQYFFQTIKMICILFMSAEAPPQLPRSKFIIIIAKRDISNPSLIANTYFSSHGLSYCLYHIICISPTTKMINCLPARLSKLSNGWRSSWGMVPNTSRYNEIIIILVIITVISKF